MRSGNIGRKQSIFKALNEENQPASLQFSHFEQSTRRHFQQSIIMKDLAHTLSTETYLELDEYFTLLA